MTRRQTWSTLLLAALIVMVCALTSSMAMVATQAQAQNISTMNAAAVSNFAMNYGVVIADSAQCSTSVVVRMNMTLASAFLPAAVNSNPAPFSGATIAANLAASHHTGYPANEVHVAILPNQQDNTTSVTGSIDTAATNHPANMPGLVVILPNIPALNNGAKNTAATGDLVS